jgi:hypothetical protein
MCYVLLLLVILHEATIPERFVANDTNETADMTHDMDANVPFVDGFVATMAAGVFFRRRSVNCGHVRFYALLVYEGFQAHLALVLQRFWARCACFSDHGR